MKIRTIQGIVEEFHIEDPGSAITEHMIRQLCKNRKIPFIRSGVKYLINFDDVKAFFDKKEVLDNDERMD